MKKIIAIIVTSLLIIVFLLGFIDKDNITLKENTADIIYSINSIPSDLSEIGSLTKRQKDIICALSRGLVELNSEGELIPSLAESVEIREEGIEYEFIIRDDVYWSDGTKITPKDITMFFREVITTENKENLGGLTNVFGVTDYIEGSKSFNEEVAIVATDESIIFRLNEKDDNFLNTLSQPQFRVRKNVLLWAKLETNYLKIPYSGNYSIIDIEKNEFTLSRNRKSDQNMVKTIHIIEDAGEDLALAAFEIGDRDLVLNPSQSQLERLSSEKKLFTIPSNKGLYMLYSKNTKLNLEVRKEIYALIIKALNDYQESNDKVFQLAEGSYFRDEEEDLNKLQARNVMTNLNDEVDIPQNIYLVAEETTENKELTNFITNWFYENTEKNFICNLVKKEEMENLHNENYYDVVLMDINSTLSDIEEFYEKVEPYISKEIIESINKKDIFKTNTVLLEESLFNNYLVLPIAFYNENIAKNINIDEVIIDGNGNLKLEEIKN